MDFSNCHKIFKYCNSCGSSRKLVIYETSKSSGLEEVVISGFENEEAIKACFDGDNNLSPYLCDGPHLRACDAVILFSKKEKGYIVFAELKTGKPKRSYVEKQFMSSVCFIDYCNSILKHFFNDFKIEECEKRFVVFYNAPLYPKTILGTTTDISSAGDPRSYDDPKTIPYDGTPVRIKKLI